MLFASSSNVDFFRISILHRFYLPAAMVLANSCLSCVATASIRLFRSCGVSSSICFTRCRSALIAAALSAFNFSFRAAMPAKLAVRIRRGSSTAATCRSSLRVFVSSCSFLYTFKILPKNSIEIAVVLCSNYDVQLERQSSVDCIDQRRTVVLK